MVDDSKILKPPITIISTNIHKSVKRTLEIHLGTYMTIIGISINQFMGTERPCTDRVYYKIYVMYIYLPISIFQNIFCI